LASVELREHIEFQVVGQDRAYLLADWLNELLFAFESRRLLLREFEVSVSQDGLQAVARGEVVDESRHTLDHEVKAVTYHGLKVEQTDAGWLAEVVLDI
jgi:SHS2 domain-containing protein